MHEADPAKGGAPVEELQKELQNVSHREQLFDNGHRIIEWHRIRAFQEVSLVQIAEDMLRQCEGFDADLALYLPDSTLVQHCFFKSPVVLYVSRRNAGAAQAVRELCLQFPEICVTRASLTPDQTSASHLPFGRCATLTKAISARSLTKRASRLSSSGPLRRLPVSVMARRLRRGGAGPSQAQAAVHWQEKTARPTHFVLYLNQQTYVDDDGALAQEIRDARAAGLPIAMMHENDKARGGCEFSNFFQSTPQDLIDGGLYSALAIAFVGGDTHRIVSQKLFAQKLGAVVSEDEVDVSLRSKLWASRSPSSSCSISRRARSRTSSSNMAVLSSGSASEVSSV